MARRFLHPFEFLCIIPSPPSVLKTIESTWKLTVASVFTEIENVTNVSG